MLLNAGNKNFPS
jgi:hypothetical protein